MTSFPSYQVQPSDIFHPGSLILIQEEITSINYRLIHCSTAFKPEILISFLKDHCLQKEWIAANSVLTELVTSGSLFNGNIETLFASSRENPPYRLAFEKYLWSQFTGS